MIKHAFFFQNDTLLLPVEFSESHLQGNFQPITAGVSLELSKDFKDPELFDVPALAACQSPPSVIHIVSVLPGEKLPDNWKGIPLRQVLALLSNSEYNAEDLAAVRACHFVHWRHDSHYCGKCGAKNTDVIPDTSGNAHRICTQCGRQEFPKICPAVITVITDSEDQILLAHNKKFRAGMYSHISGFNEPGETLEETVVREIREEINIEVKNVVYIKSQPWPFPNSLMLGFKARYSSGSIRPDGDEIEDAKWFTKDNLPDLPGEGSLSRYLINIWLDGTLDSN